LPPFPLPNKIHEREMDKTDIPGTFNAGATLGPVNETNMSRIWNKHKQSNTPLKRKVFVGLSGGVDSSVSAALLLQQGYDVTGVFIKIWQPEWTECTMAKDRLDAMRVCAHLDIPFKEIDLTEDYKRDVVDYMISEYKEGRTPNPDVTCNRFIKFGRFFTWAIEQGADYVATGHYAQIGKLRAGGLELRASKDQSKDQTYFLWTLKQKQLAETLFPVGALEKSEVRKLANKFKLPTAEKKDSQGLCFVGPVDIKGFLSRYVPQKQGAVLNEKGEVIGRHDGAWFLTIGERHGFTTTKKSPHDEPFYILNKDIDKNTITVGVKSKVITSSPDSVRLSSVNWITSAPSTDKIYEAQIRYHGTRYPCVFEADGLTITFQEKSDAVAYGQSLVFYDGDTCLGGGVMELFK